MKETLDYVLKKNGAFDDRERPDTIDTARILFAPPREKEPGDKKAAALGKEGRIREDGYPVKGICTTHKVGPVTVEIRPFYQQGLDKFGKKIEVGIHGAKMSYTDDVELPSYCDTPDNRKSVEALAQRVLDRLIEELVKSDGEGGDPYETLEGLWNVKSELAKTIHLK